MTVEKNAELLAELGFVTDAGRPNVLVLANPIYPELKLVAFGDARIAALDLFTELGSNPMNYPGDPRNICIRVQDHNPVFSEAVIRTVVNQFYNLF